VVSHHTTHPRRFVLAISGLCAPLGAMGTALSSTLAWGILSAAVIGSGVSGLHLLLRLAWADYYGRQHLGHPRHHPAGANRARPWGQSLPVRVRRHRELPDGVSLLRRCGFGSMFVLAAIRPQRDRPMTVEADETPRKDVTDRLTHR
jgi:hypothetical protein